MLFYKVAIKIIQIIRETMIKYMNKVMKTMSYQIEYVKTWKLYLKKQPNGNSGVKIYSNWNKEYARGAQQK